MEVTEGVKLFTPLVNKKDECKVKHNDKPWKARINKDIGSGPHLPCTGKKLYENMGKDQKKGFLSGRKPYIEKVAGSWELDDVDQSHFPIQAHHLIPKNHLPLHAVCTFLGAGYKQNKLYRLQKDTYYDTDDASNGYCMPYATPLKEWKDSNTLKDPAKKAKTKQDLAFDVMDQTKRQLHQGSHRDGPYGDDPDDESIHVEGDGYLDTIDLLLGLVQTSASTHADGCSLCADQSTEKPKKIFPRPSVVRHVDQVSGLVKLLVDSNEIFVSEYASKYWKANKLSPRVPKWLKKK